MSMYYYWRRTAWVALIAILLSSCAEEDGGGKLATTEDVASDVVQKSATVIKFTKINAHAHNFNLDRPDLLGAEGKLLYVGTKNTKNLFAWQVEQGNGAAAWHKLDRFTSLAGPANFNLESPQKKLLSLSAIQGGVAVTLSRDGTAGVLDPQPGLAVFRGTDRQARHSIKFPDFLGFADVDIKEVRNAKNERSLYLVHYDSATDRTMVLWSNLSRVLLDAQGFIAPANTLKFSGTATPMPLTHGPSALAGLADGRVALAVPAMAAPLRPLGLWTIKAASVGVANGDNPELQQSDETQVLDVEHENQWKSAQGNAPSKISAMQLVDKKYLVVGFSGTNQNGGFKYADIRSSPWIFSSNIEAPTDNVTKIVASDQEARLIAGKKVYSFKDGIFALEIDSQEISMQLAYISRGASSEADNPPADVTPSVFERGGYAGQLPLDNSTFFDAAPLAGHWYYANSSGLFLVEKLKVFRAFSVDKGK